MLPLEIDRQTLRELALERHADSIGAGKTASGVEPVLTAAASGRVDTLFVADEAEAWGGWDAATFRAEVRPEAAEGDEDLIEVTVEETAAHGGDAWSLPADRMPTPAPVAATLRY
jgi:hypothetical protein